jgi:2-oxo-4-hydroxy-4-carboxy-5-ureidoimidazoline decarboxylase
VNLDAIADDKAAELLRACCGSSRWVAGMIESRPFGSATNARKRADEIWNGLAPEDWLEAFSHHPRIGERAAAVKQNARGSAWSSEEQSGMGAASGDVKADLARVNEDYERRFGFIYIVCASGKSAADLLAIAQSRLGNAPDTELRVAAEEQRKIMQLRLSKLLDQAEKT